MVLRRLAAELQHAPFNVQLQQLLRRVGLQPLTYTQGLATAAAGPGRRCVATAALGPAPCSSSSAAIDQLSSVSCSVAVRQQTQGVQLQHDLRQRRWYVGPARPWSAAALAEHVPAAIVVGPANDLPKSSSRGSSRPARNGSGGGTPSGGGSGGGVLSKFLSRRRGRHAEEEESARSLPDVTAGDAALLEGTGGDPKRLEALLRTTRRTQLFNAALRTVPAAQLRPVLDVLLDCAADGAASPAAAGDLDTGSRDSSSPGGGAGRATSGAAASDSGTAARRGAVPASAFRRCRPDQVTAQTLLHRLPSAGMHAEVDSIMRRLLDAGLPPSYKSFLPWASLHARRGSIAGVRHVMGQVEERCGAAAVGSHYFAQLIRAYNTCGRWREAEALLQEMRERGVQPSEHIYRALVYVCGEHHRADRAQAVFDDMVASGLAPSSATWSALINAYAEARQPRGAIEVLLSMRKQGQAPCVSVWGALIKAFARSGDWRRALEVLDVMQAEGLAPNEQVYGCAVEAAAAAGKPSVAESVVQRMRAAGVTPNVIAYTSLLSAYAATRDLDAAQRVLDQMAEAGCRPNGKTYTELMSQLAAMGQYEECERYFQRMVAEGWPADRISYSILLDSMLHQWASDKEANSHLLPVIEQRWHGAAPLEPHTYLHQPQGRLMLDLHGFSGWGGQLAVLATLQGLLEVHQELGRGGAGGGIAAHISRLDVITGRGNRSTRKHRPVVRELVLEMLQHLLPVGMSKNNDGLLLLEARHLRRLFDSVLDQGKSFGLVDMAHCLVEPT